MAFLISAPGIIYSVYNILTLALMLPGLSIAVRRIHDVGKSGWFLLILLIPLIGFFWCLYLFCKPSDSGTNQYGNEPL